MSDDGSGADHRGPARIGVVLSAGGLRGAAHLGVLQRLVQHDIPIDVLVGVSAGAIVAAYYAAVGRSLDSLMSDAKTLRGRHLVAHSMNVRLGYRFDAVLGRLSGLIPERLQELDGCRFDRLHNGVRGLGIVCCDVNRKKACYFATGQSCGARLGDVAKASASIPGMIPPRVCVVCGRERTLTDGGLVDAVPVEFALRAPLSATHLVVSDCRAFGSRVRLPPRAIYLRPRISATGTLWAPPSTLLRAVDEGAMAVTDDVLRQIRRWFEPGTHPRGPDVAGWSGSGVVSPGHPQP